ncbi:hypothetical protein H0H92_011618 [Tricholoma furcatifolium]|nr:hypothetical protein H0H92_011618 [Tricholoma furcatifolium]
MTNASESTPLLAQNVSNDASSYVSRKKILRTWVGTYREELGILAKYALPVFGIIWVSVFSIGHTSTTALSAVSLGTLTANVTAFTIMLGFAAALDTMLPSAWTSSQPQLVGLWSQRMLVLMWSLLIPILILWFNVEPVFLLFKQDPEVAQLTAQYLRWLSLGLPAYAFNCVSRRYFQSQGYFAVPTFIIAMVAPVNVALNYLLVWGPKELQIGFIGAPVATAISFNLVSILFVAYGMLFLPSTAWHPLSMRMLTNLRKLFILGAGGALQLAAEWFTYEILALEATILGPTSLASQSVLQAISSMLFQVFHAVSIVTSVRIGNLLGEAKAKRAKVVAETSIMMTLVIAGSIKSVLCPCPQITAAVVWVGLFQVFDALTAVLAGILRARGKQVIGALLLLSAYYGVDWDREVRKAMNRLREHDNSKTAAGCHDANARVAEV